jgi:protein associated with RNAse G/E
MLMHSTKYDGSLHYQYPVEVIDRSADRLVTWTAPGAAVRSYRGAKTGVRNILSFFWLGRPYVLHALWDADWRPQFLYIDLDLDVILHHGAPSSVLADEDEFAEHRVKFNYPEELVAQCHRAVAEVRGLLGSGTVPFTTDLFAWRPGTAAPKDSGCIYRPGSTLTPPSPWEGEGEDGPSHRRDE